MSIAQKVVDGGGLSIKENREYWLESNGAILISINDDTDTRIYEFPDGSQAEVCQNRMRVIKGATMKTLSELPDSEAVEIFLAHRNGELEYCDKLTEGWLPKPSRELIYPNSIYRIAKRPITVDWSYLHERWRYVMKGASGKILAATREPWQTDQQGDWATTGRLIVICDILASLDRGTVDACDSLICRP